jgi:transcriptional regulator with XRE-family HTH domain
MHDLNLHSLEALRKSVKATMQELSLNQSELAAYSNVSRKFVSEFLGGKNAAQLDKTLLITNALGIDFYPFSLGREFGSIFSHARKAQGLDQVTAASLCGVSTNFLSALENNKQTVQLDKVFAVIRNLNIQEDD